jgi:hypothetical protein
MKAKQVHRKIIEAKRVFANVNSNQAQAKARFALDELLKEQKETKLRLRQSFNKQQTYAKKSKHHAGRGTIHGRRGERFHRRGIRFRARA